MQIVIEVPDDLKDTCDNDDIDEAMKHVTWFSLTLALAIRDGIVLSEQQAKKMAIEALKAQPCDEQSVYMRAYREGYDKGYADGDFFARHENEIKESCEDAVKREAVLNTLDTMDKALDENRTVEHYKELLKECYKELPRVTPTAKESLVVGDAVSREAALKALGELPHEYKTKEQRARTGGIAACQVIVRELPPVTPKQRWIPVSERLPEESLNSVLGWDDNRERCVFVQYVNGRFQFVGRDSSFKITAWMPLPEPYKEGESE